MHEGEISDFKGRGMNPSMLENLFKENYARLCYFAFKLTGDLPAAEDIVQDCFVKWWSRSPELPTETNMKAYLYQSVRNACLNLRRHTEVEKRYAKREGMPTESNEGRYLDFIIRAEVLGEINKAIETLPPGCRQVLKLSYFESLKNEEIAEALGISINTVKTQKARALKLLQVKLTIPALSLLLLPFRQ